MNPVELEGREFLDVVHWYRMQLSDDPAERIKLNDELVGPLSSHEDVSKEDTPQPKIKPPKWWRGSTNASDANMAAIKMAEARRKQRGRGVT